MSRVSFHLNDTLVEVGDISPTTTLLNFLRRNLRLTGTKEGCAEGDCGACTVAIVDTDSSGPATFRGVNSCLVLVPMLHGKRVYTVEGLAEDGKPHMVQEALTQALGSQCGYCTPGVIMSMFEACYRQDLDAAWKLDDQMCGNLCRCTGYRPIRDATREIAAQAPPDRFRQALEKGEDGDTALSFEFADQRFFMPTDKDTLFDLIDAHPDHRFVCGATDLGLDVTKRHTRFPCLISLEGLGELRSIEAIAGGWSIGGTVLLSDLEAASETILPPMARMLRFFGSRQIKNRATLGGNLCNASPIGDTPPVLLALDATVVALGRGGERRIAMSDFFQDYRKTALLPGEILARVEVPELVEGTLAGAYKVSKRRELDISAVAATMLIRRDSERKIIHARIAYGGMAATPKRAISAEDYLLGREWTEASAVTAAGLVQKAFTPLSDHRGSAAYRSLLAKNLLIGFFEETKDGHNRVLPDRPTATVLLEGGP